MRKYIGFIVIFGVLTAFTINESLDYHQKVNSRSLLNPATNPQGKGYLQTDKPQYTAGETIRFKACLLNAVTRDPSRRGRFVYVELTDAQDKVLQRVKITGRDSVLQGHLSLPVKLAQGNYMLRAYSDGMQNPGEDYLFKKQIKVLNIRTSSAGNMEREGKKKNPFVF